MNTSRLPFHLTSHLRTYQNNFSNLYTFIFLYSKLIIITMCVYQGVDGLGACPYLKMNFCICVYLYIFPYSLLLKSLKRPAPLSYCYYVRQAMVLSRYKSCSHAVKNTFRSKEETDNTLRDKTEQVTFGMKQSFFIFCHFLRKFKL